MNRRGFFKGMLAAACTAVARAYVPAAMTMSEVPLASLGLAPHGPFGRPCTDEEMADWRMRLRVERVDLSQFTVRFTMRDGTPSPTVQAWLDECGAIVTKHMREGA